MYRFPRIASLRLLLFSLLAIVLLAGCSTHNLRIAQDKFEEGSLQEWLIRNDSAQNPNAVSLLTATMPYTVSYREALDLVRENITKNKDSLIKDKLYGDALLLKSVCLWKLDGTIAQSADTAVESADVMAIAGVKPVDTLVELQETIDEARKVRSSFPTEKWQLLILSEQFLEADRAVALVQPYNDENLPVEIYKIVRTKLVDANAQIKNALDEPDIQNNIPLKRYLIFARITILKNYIGACKSLKDQTKEQATFQAGAESELEELETDFEELSANETKKLF